MTATDAGSVMTADPASRFSRPQRLAIQALVLLSRLSLTRMWTGFDNLTSSGTIGAALRLTVPILLAGLAALWSDRVGVVNIGIEGMMILGTWFGGYAAWQWGAWVGVIFAIGGGLIGVLGDDDAFTSRKNIAFDNPWWRIASHCGRDIRIRIKNLHATCWDSQILHDFLGVQFRTL